MNIVARDTQPAYCTRTQHIELRLAAADDAPIIAQLIDVWFPMTIWRDCLSFDTAKATTFIARGIESGTEPFILAFDPVPKNFPETDFSRNTIQELVGFISWHLWSRFTEPVGVLDEVFVVPRLRRSDLGRRLILTAVTIARAEGAKVFNFPVCSGMPEQVSLINMLRRHLGAEPVGTILRLRFPRNEGL